MRIRLTDKSLVRMWRIGAIFWLAAVPGIVFAAADNALEKFLSATQTLRSDFEQEIYSADGELVERSDGRLAIRRPGKFRWEYNEPAQLIVADGERLWLYDVDLDQVTVSDQGDKLAGSPAALLGGSADLKESFKLVRAHTEGDIDWVRLAPLQPDSDFEFISVGLRNSALVVMELTDALGQLTRIRFHQLETNADIAATEFVVDIPEGVDVIDRSNSGEQNPDSRSNGG